MNKKHNTNKNAIANAVNILSKSTSVEEAADSLGLSSRSLRRLFANNGMLQPACYLPLPDKSLTKNQKRRIRELYSEFGGPYTKEQIAKELQVPLEKISEYIKEEKITHKILPVEEDPLMLDSDKIKAALEVRDYKIKAKLEQLEMQKAKDITTKWDFFKKEFVEPIFSLMEDLVPQYQIEKLSLQQNKTPDNFAAVLSIQDFHFGRLASAMETKEDTDMEIQERELISCIKDLIAKVSRFGVPEILYLTIGGDFFNSDNSKGKTTHGTPQDSFPSYANILVKGFLLLVKAIDLLRQFFPYIELVVTAGNHDNDSSLSLYMAISAWFKDCEDVFTFFDMQQPNLRKRQYRQYGDNLLAFAHGDGGAKTKSLPTVIAAEARELWGKTKHTLLTTGHYHYRISQDLFGIQHVQMPTIAKEDRWGESNGYINQKGMSIILVDKENGLFAEVLTHP